MIALSIDRERAAVFGPLSVLATLIPAIAGAATLQVRADAALDIKVQSVHWTLSGPFAEQQVDMVLRNPSSRAAEGTVLLPLASHERLKGYALDVEGRLRDAMPVERTKARVAFESTVRQQVDPGLLERDAGSRYRLRVFPIPPQGERRLRFTIASLAQRDRCGWRHRMGGDVLPIGAQIVGTVSSTETPRPAAGGMNWSVEPGGKIWRSQVVLRAGVERETVCLRAPFDPIGYTFRGADGTAVLWVETWGRDKPALEPRPTQGRVEILWDASLQSPRDRSAELAVLGRYFQGATTRVTLTVLRQETESRSFEVKNGDWSVLAAHLQTLRPLGATNLDAWAPEADAQEVLFFGDAAATWPSTAEMRRPGKPVFVITNGIQDMAKAQWLAQEGGLVIDLARRSADAAARDLRQVAPLRLLGGWRQHLWHAPSRTPEGGLLRACHIAPKGHSAELPVMRVERRGAVRDIRPKNPQPHEMAAFWCANWWVQTLEAQPGRHRGQLAELGQQYGVVNRETSLLVLERVQDYVRHGILPPDADAGIKDAVMLARARQDQARAANSARNRLEIERLWAERRTWWTTEFPKTPRNTEPATISRSDAMDRRAAGAPNPALMASPPPPVGMAVPRPVTSAAPAPTAAAAAAPASAQASMTMRAVSVSEPCTGDLKSSADADAVMQAFDRLAFSYGGSPAFHFDTAERLFELDAMPLAVQVLSNIVEMMPSEHAALRLVAYRLQQAGAHAQALDLLHRIRELAPDEPQSYRDLALALAREGRCQPAVDLLAHVVQTPWDGRYSEIGLIALAEANDLGVQCREDIPNSLPETWRAPLPVDLRVVLQWDLNDTDIDVHVSDPLGETVYFGNRLGRQGGKISRDFTGGYGPEEFVLRKPVPGIYTVKVNYYGSRIAKLARGAGISIQLQTGFATPQVKTKVLTMRLAEGSGLIEIGHFEVLPQGGLAP